MHYPHRAPSGPWEHLSPGQPCSPRLHGSPAHRARPACMAALLTLPQREKKPTGRVLGYSAESALLLVVRAIPSAPSLFTTVVATVLERMQFAHSLLSFCTSFSQLSRCGLATPSHRDGSCAGSPVCRQPVLRTLCLTKVKSRVFSFSAGLKPHSGVALQTEARDSKRIIRRACCASTNKRMQGR
jgi:hypothetical protein